MCPANISEHQLYRSYKAYLSFRMFKLTKMATLFRKIFNDEKKFLLISHLWTNGRHFIWLFFAITSETSRPTIRDHKSDINEIGLFNNEVTVEKKIFQFLKMTISFV
jgi:hypothetical protein